MREVNHSPLPSAKAENQWSYKSAHPVRLHGEDSETFLLVKLYTFCVISPLSEAVHAEFSPLRESSE